MSKSPNKSPEQLIRETARNWATPYLTRAEAEKFSGGAVNSRTLANEDCLGTGPNRAFRIGKRVLYPVDAFAEYLINKVKRLKGGAE